VEELFELGDAVGCVEVDGGEVGAGVVWDEGDVEVGGEELFYEDVVVGVFDADGVYVVAASVGCDGGCGVELLEVVGEGGDHVIIWWILVRNSGSRRSMVVPNNLFSLWWVVSLTMVRVLSFWVIWMYSVLVWVRIWQTVVVPNRMGWLCHLCGVVWLRWC